MKLKKKNFEFLWSFWRFQKKFTGQQKIESFIR
jgi:hypothetical protein